MKEKILRTEMLKVFFLFILTGLLSTGQAFAQLKDLKSQMLAITVDMPAPKSYYDFEEGSGTTVTDGGTAQNNGTLEGSDISFTTGGVVSSTGVDGCVEITSGTTSDGTSFVDIPYADFHNGNNYTFTAWVKWNIDSSKGWAYIFWQDGDGSDNTRHVDLWWHLTKKGPASVLYDENEGEVKLISDDPGINIYDGEWHMVAITLEDGTTSKIYADGNKIFENTSSTPIVKTATTNHLQIGAMPGMNMVGKIDKVGIYDVALSEDQIEALYTAEGVVGTPTSISKYENSLKSSLKQNFPNPFSNETTIRYELRVAGHVRLQILDITGNVISTLVEENLQTGSHNAKWNANSAAKGIYFYKLTLSSKEGAYQSTKKMIVK